MLGKLLIYDFKWIYKLVAIFYVLEFIFSVIGRALSTIENSIVFSILSKTAFVIAIIMMVGSLINCLIRLFERFIKNVYKDESYLTHTLPVEKKTIFVSKVIVGLISIFTTTIVTIVCLFICFYSKQNIQELKTMLEFVATTFDTTVLKMLLLISVVIFLELIYVLLTGYVGIIIGHKTNKNKMSKSIVLVLVFYFVLHQLLTLGLIGILGLLNPDIMNLINTKDTVNINTIKQVMYAIICMYIAEIIFFYILGQKQLNKGVNVE